MPLQTLSMLSSSLHEFIGLSMQSRCRGRSGLLYTPAELTTPARHTAQAIMLQHEAQLVKEAFNELFKGAQAAKADMIAVVAEHGGKVAAIERELGWSSSARADTAVLVRPPATDKIGGCCKFDIASVHLQHTWGCSLVSQ